jgi:glycosyltransferase involved in cell wall biosynthesis
MNLSLKNEHQMDRDNIKVDVIVPVYRGLQETRACLESVLANPQSTKFELIVIDDYSPEAELSAWLEDMAGKNKFTLLKNLSNLGFVQTVNRGMKLHSGMDALEDWLLWLKYALGN